MGPASWSIARSMSVLPVSSPRLRARRKGTRSRSRCRAMTSDSKQTATAGLCCVDHEGVEEDVALGTPPAVDGLLGHAGPSGYAFDCQISEAPLGQQVVSRLQNGQPGLLASPVPVAVVAGLAGAPQSADRGASCSAWSSVAAQLASSFRVSCGRVPGSAL